jgi:hypothetical protein
MKASASSSSVALMAVGSMATGSKIGDGKRAARSLAIRVFNDYLAETTDAARRGVALLACECGGDECSESLSVGYAGYDAARNHPRGLLSSWRATRTVGPC